MGVGAGRAAVEAMSALRLADKRGMHNWFDQIRGHRQAIRGNALYKPGEFKIGTTEN